MFTAAEADTLSAAAGEGLLLGAWATTEGAAGALGQGLPERCLLHHVRVRRVRGGAGGGR